MLIEALKKATCDSNDQGKLLEKKKLTCLNTFHIGWGKSRFTVVHMENNTVTNK